MEPRGIVTQMPLTKDEILKSVKITDGRDDGFGTASYDLHARFVIKHPEKAREWPAFLRGRFELTDSGFMLEPQGMVRVISTESIELPVDVIGYALVKNDLSNRNVLAINIGIVDPCYSGPISSTLINFGSEPFLITRETLFLRLVFHRCGAKVPMRTFDILGRDAYVDRTAEAVRRFSSHTFLNLHKTEEKAAAVAFGRYRKWVVVAATIGALLFGAIAVFAPLGANLVEKSLTPTQSNASSVADLTKELATMRQSYDDALRSLQSRVVDLERRDNLKTRQ